MDGIRFLAVDSVFYLHGKSIEFWGGAEGIRDENALLSAIEAPRQSFVYGEVRDLFLLAATYAFHIAEAQAFRDGNKRAGIGAALLFLQGNGVFIVPDSSDMDRLYDGMIGLATKAATKEGLAETLRSVWSRRPLVLERKPTDS